MSNCFTLKKKKRYLNRIFVCVNLIKHCSIKDDKQELLNAV